MKYLSSNAISDYQKYKFYKTKVDSVLFRYRDMALPALSIHRPEVYTYHDIHQFLLEYFEYLRKLNSHFSLRKLALSAGFSSGLLPSILARRVVLSKQTLDKIAPFIDLSKPELRFLEWLRQLSESPSQDDRLKAYQNICRHGKYKGKNQGSIETYKYLKHWYYPVIRELANLPDFEFDAKWIRKQLNSRITLTEAKQALGFLVDNGYIIKNSEGKPQPNEKNIVCSGGVFKLTMSEYHQQVLNLAIKSIYDTPSDFRDLNTHTLAISKEQFPVIRDILAEALDKIRKISTPQTTRNSIYEVCLMSFPVAETIERVKK